MKHFLGAALLFSLLGFGVSCGPDNAILEVQANLPRTSTAAGAADTFVLIQVRPSVGFDFTSDWGGPNLSSTKLIAERQEDTVSVIGDGMSEDVHIKFRFCRSSDCTNVEDANAAELWYRLEQPLYVGKRTTWAVSIDRLPFILRPTVPEEIGRCEIRGCVDGASPSYCRLDGSHVCEDPGS